MFKTITWEIYTITALTIGLVYYVISALLLYRSELIRWLKSQPSSSQPPSRETESIATHDNVMGGINPSEAAQRTSSADPETIAVSTHDEIPEDIVLSSSNSSLSRNDHLLVGSVADLLEEIKTLIQVIAEYKSSKPESRAFFHALFIRYPQLAGTSYQEAISLYICDAARNQFSFELSFPEVTSWWK